MAKSSNVFEKIVGLALVVIGAGLAWWGYQLSGSFGAQLSKTLSGALPDEVMYRYIGGGVCGVVGLFLVLKK